MPWYLYLALKQLFPSGRRPSSFFLVSVCGIMLGVMILVVCQSVMAGFGDTYRQKLIETTGHIEISARQIIQPYEGMLEWLDQQPEVSGATPFAQGVVMLQHNGRPTFPGVRGIDLDRETTVVPLNEFLKIGTLDDLDDDSVFLSYELAASIGAFDGDTVEVLTPLMIEMLERDQVLLPRELRVAGLFQTGWSDIDSSTMIVTKRLMQELYGLGNGVHGISVRLHEGVNEFDFAVRLEEELPSQFRVMTWFDKYADFLWVLELEKNILFFLLIFIVIVAAFAISNTQTLTVLRKTREIGLLQAIGGTPRQLMAGYCFQGFLIGSVGTAFGWLLAITILYFRNPIIHTIARWNGSEDVLIKFYQFSDLPVTYTVRDVIIITVSALLLTTVASLIPAYRAAKMLPADALRHE